MFTLALKNLLNNKLRLALTAAAIVLGIGFMVSSLVLRDGLKDSFSSLSKEIVGQTDLQVTAANEAKNVLGTADLETVRQTEGVEAAAGSVFTSGPTENSIQAIKSDGSTIANQGPPQIALGWVKQPELNSNRIDEGRSPDAEGEWTVDLDSAAIHGFEIGKTYDFITPSGRKSAKLVGTFSFGENNATNGATLYGFSNETMRSYLGVDADFLSTIQIRTSDGADIRTVLERVSVTLGNPPNSAFDDTNQLMVIVKNQSDLISESEDQFNVIINIFGGVLFGFALVSLFVSTFIIANTFSIVAAQRTREIGLMRAVGATPGQIRLSVITESAVVGLVASLVGLGAGVAIAAGMAAILDAVGQSLPPFELTVSSSTVLIALSVGTVITVVAALAPAFAASQTSPVAAITGASNETVRSTRRYVAGGLMFVVGLLMITVGLVGNVENLVSVLGFLGAGAAVLFIGITMLSPLIAGRVGHILGAPFSPLFGIAGGLAVENAARNPRRTASTAAALMIGLSLVSMALIMGESFKAEFNRALDTGIQADYFVTGQGSDIPFEVVNELKANDVFTGVNASRSGRAALLTRPSDPANANEAGGYDISISTTDYTTLDGVQNFGVVDGSLAAINGSTVALFDEVAEELSKEVGDSVELPLNDGSTVDLVVAAIYENSLFAGNVWVSADRFEDSTTISGVQLIVAKRNETSPIESSDAAFGRVAARYPNLKFDAAADFRGSFSSQIDAILNTLTALLGLAIFTALLGIANTLALSVFERTKEIGLLRATGMSRRQVRRMIRLEASLISGLGAFLGAGIGASLGTVAVLALPNTVVSELAIPWTRIGLLVILGSLSGLLAAVAPAFRAAKLSILAAIGD